MSLTTPEITQYLLMAGAAIGLLGGLWGVLKGARAGLRSDLRAIVREENQPLHQTQTSHGERISNLEAEHSAMKRTQGFLLQRSAGLEAKVFDRPPILEEDIA